MLPVRQLIALARMSSNSIGLCAILAFVLLPTAIVRINTDVAARNRSSNPSHVSSITEIGSLRTEVAVPWGIG